MPVTARPRVRPRPAGLALGLALSTALLSPSAQSASHEMKHAANGMVASRSALASQVGAQMLAQGGNAIDAAVATGFALAVTYPSAGNLAGGGFMVIRLADGQVITNDHREVAPAAATQKMYQDANGEVIDGLSTATHLAIGVPGTVDGLLAIQARYGKFDRKTVIAPALKFARDGITVSYDLSRSLQRRRKQFEKFPASMAKFFKADGTAYAAGELFKQSDLAQTLKRISEHGREGFYQGRTAELIVAEMQRGNGIITLEDLAAYQSVWREPVRGSYRDHEVLAMPPPSSGGVLVVQMLNMLEAYDVGAMGYGSADAIHLMIEAERRAYADLAEHLGDPDFYPVPLDRLLDKDYARKRMASFEPGKASRSDDIFAGSWPQESRDTTHVSVMDSAGNAVAYTTTLNLGYGSKIVAAGTGMLMNNEMDDFSSKEDTPNAFGLLGRKANAIAPGKRMLSSMSPTIVLKDGQPMLVTGSPGGSTIITTVFQVLVNVIDHGMDLSNAVGKPRFHHQWQPDRIAYEKYGISPDTLATLKARGHQKMSEVTWGRGIGDANSVMRVGDDIQGMNDPRNDGAAAGY